MTTTAALLIAGIAWLMPSAFGGGLIVRAGAAATVAALALVTSRATGTAHMTAGATAEQWTAAELRKLRSAGWRIVNDFALEA